MISLQGAAVFKDKEGYRAVQRILDIEQQVVCGFQATGFKTEQDAISWIARMEKAFAPIGTTTYPDPLSGLNVSITEFDPKP